jgi:hypothetical protein
MNNAFEQIFNSAVNELKRTIDESSTVKMNDSSEPVTIKKSGSMNVDFTLDQCGNYHYEAEEYGAGVTVNTIFTINEPDALYTVKVSSSDGGGGYFVNIKAGQNVSCKFSTSLWHKTKISIDIHANVSNITGHGVINYAY